jgi:hypothetical protein
MEPRRLAEDHLAFVRDLAAASHLRQRQVYLVLAGAHDAGADDPGAPAAGRWRRAPRAASGPATPADRAVRALTDHCADWEHRLRAAGVDAHRLDGGALAGLLYRLLCPGLAARQPLPGDPAALAAGLVQAPAHQRQARLPRIPGQPAAGAAELAELAARGFRDPRDRLSPGSCEETPDWLRLDDRYAATLAVVGYPRQVAADWPRRLLLDRPAGGADRARRRAAAGRLALRDGPDRVAR